MSCLGYSFFSSYTQGSPVYLWLPGPTFKQQLPLMPAACSSCEPGANAAAAVKSPSMRQALKCAVLGLMNSMINNVMAGLFECVIKGVDFWS